MSGHLCLKWNNHSTAFIRSISNIHIKERYCDATIVCQGKYFPVHRVVLSTCSDYFDEMFERMQCQHPYIVFKDIDPNEMALLLSYMYQGEVNVVQENLPTLIKAAEALKVKGLAVPDDLPSKESSGKKRSNTSNDVPAPKRRSEEKRRRRDSSDQTPHPSTSSSSSQNREKLDTSIEAIERKPIKDEPLDTGYSDPPRNSDYREATYSGVDSTPSDNRPTYNDKSEEHYPNLSLEHGTNSYVKEEHQDSVLSDQFSDEQAGSWDDFTNSDIMQDLPPESTPQDDVRVEIEEDGFYLNFDTDDDSERDVVLDYSSLKTSEGYVCPYCRYVSKRLHNTKRHIRSKHTGERPFPCTVCEKRFPDKVELRIHTRLHTGEKPFQCPVCGRKFSQNSHMNSHKKNVHKLA